MTRIYLDHAATTPMVPEAVEAMSRELGRIGNASSLHGSGRAARRVVEEARESIAAHVGAQPAELIFTSGGTEADNLAVKGAYWSLAPQGRTKVIISAVEHHAVLDSAGWLAQSAGATTHQVPVDAQGRLDRQALADAVDDTTALVSLMWANNEVGTRQPVELAAALARQQGALSHSDAVQAVGHLAVHFGRSGLDLMTFTAHKLGGPYGIGALLARREVKLTATQHGGGQERELRSGTFDVAAAAGFAAALEVAVRGREQEEARIRALRTELIGAVRAAVGNVVLHGTLDPADSLPGVTNLGFPGCRSDSLLMLLDESGIDCSAGSACSSGVPEPSYVLSAMGVSDEAAQSAVRFSLGHSSTSADVQALAAALPTAMQRSRAAAAFA